MLAVHGPVNVNLPDNFCDSVFVSSKCPVGRPDPSKCDNVILLMGCKIIAVLIYPVTSAVYVQVLFS